MTSLHFLKRFILNEVNYFIVRDQYEIFFLEGHEGEVKNSWIACDVIVF